MEKYHGIIINLSQKDKSIFKTMNIIGRQKAFLGMVALYKVEIDEQDLELKIRILQENMADRVLFFHRNFYLHFYRGNELIVVFKNRVFHATPDKSSWLNIIAYGQKLGIKDKQLDFSPHTIAEEKF